MENNQRGPKLHDCPGDCNRHPQSDQNPLQVWDLPPPSDWSPHLIPQPVTNKEGPGAVGASRLEHGPPGGVPEDDGESRLPPRLDPAHVSVKGDVARGDQRALQKVGQHLALGAKPTDDDRVDHL